jgi:hypothetical protein
VDDQHLPPQTHLPTLREDNSHDGGRKYKASHGDSRTRETVLAETWVQRDGAQTETVEYLVQDKPTVEGV